jgi:hypothetical protein
MLLQNSNHNVVQWDSCLWLAGWISKLTSSIEICD